MKHAFILVLLLAAGCDGRIRIPEDEFIYRTSPNEPGYEKIGVKLEQYKKLEELADADAADNTYLRKRIDNLLTELSEARERIRELESKQSR